MTTALFIAMSILCFRRRALAVGKAGLWLPSGYRLSCVFSVVSLGFIPTSLRHSVLMRLMFRFSMSVWI
jgi:hypothetical protein